MRVNRVVADANWNNVSTSWRIMLPDTARGVILGGSLGGKMPRYRTHAEISECTQHRIFKASRCF